MEYGGSSWGTYTIPKEENLKGYYIKNESFTDSNFKTGKVITPIEGTSGKDRFYVMSLKDIDSSRHPWYYNAPGKLDKTAATSKNDFGQGRENTEYVNGKWKDSLWGAQNSNDMWGIIQDEIADGWFVPSKSEWAAFGVAFGITSSNYSSTYGLSDHCWSSSQYATETAYYADFSRGLITNGRVSSGGCVRLATTF